MKGWVRQDLVQWYIVSTQYVTQRGPTFKSKALDNDEVFRNKCLWSHYITLKSLTPIGRFFLFFNSFFIFYFILSLSFFFFLREEIWRAFLWRQVFCEWGVLWTHIYLPKGFFFFKDHVGSIVRITSI